MRDSTTRNFGLLIAYITPGFVGLWGASFVVPDLRELLLGSTPEGPSLGGFLYVTVGSIAAGMLANAVRWAVLDTAHHLTGLKPPRWNDAALHDRVSAYEWLVENHYRHYQFYGNTLVSLVFAHICWRISVAEVAIGVGKLDAATLLACLVLIAGSRSTLSRYYRRVGSLLGEQEKGE
ncbi:MAG: hypothetical protein ACIAQ0_09180 [Phycisphaerales bacterium JB058]